MDYSADFALLPSGLRNDLAPHYDREDHGSVASGIAEYIESGGAPTPEMIVVLACATFLDAIEVMVDNVVPASETALALLEDPILRRGGDHEHIEALRREIRLTLHESAKQTDAETAKAVAAIADGGASSEDLAAAAHRQWDRRQYEPAARLFLEAAERESKEAAGRHRNAAPDRSMNYLVRAGQCFYKAGLVSEALPLLKRATSFDWEQARLWNDRHTSEWAFVSLLEDRANSGDWDGFGQLWAEAIRRAEELKMKFPLIHPHQELLLDICMAAEKIEYLPRIVEQIEARDARISKELRKKVSEARRRIADDKVTSAPPNCSVSGRSS